ncbi:MAG: hypothetical protein RMY34_00030 [Aulosira sp. DedQUE10]|nr:hypothetical protein [Aulosira sp. DedQUE10]
MTRKKPPKNGKPPKTESGALWFNTKKKIDNQQPPKKMNEPT